ncbi:MAG: hypothetical protein ABIK15_06830 [Pseudomonadota bacterium]
MMIVFSGMKKAGILFVSVLIWLYPAFMIAGPLEPTATFLLTANLQGNFSTSAENQDQEDSMLVMAQALIQEKEKKSGDLMIDLGNAFYPGLLSKFSYGSVMMDYLDYFGFAATLVSSNDLNIGLGNLTFLAQSKKTTLLSANIEKNGQTVFSPYFTSIIKGKQFGFIGITSPKGFLDVAEKQLFEAGFCDIHQILSIHIDRLKAEKTDYIVLLSGLSYEENFDLMEKHPDISLCISGGDSEGKLFMTSASRVDMDSGRSLVTLTKPDGFYSLTLAMGEKLEVDTLRFTHPSPSPTYSQNYLDFIKRLTLWKSQFASEGNQAVTENFSGQLSLNGHKTAELLRHRFGVEVVLLDKKAISPGMLAGRVTYSDILFIVNDDFPLFTYRISGKELKNAIRDQGNLLAAGIDNGQVQGYPINDKRTYRICSTQKVFERIEKQSDRVISYTNSWKSISDMISEDLKTDQVIAKNDFHYLDRRFGLLVDVSLSNFFEQSDVSRGSMDDVPPGKPTDSYTKWGIEDKIDFTIYNRYHQLILTPYIYFVSKDDDYLQNQLRGTLVYTYNLYPNVKPYHKSQADTVVQDVDGKRPLMFRETAGALFETRYLNGKLGLGFEKQTRDPANELVAGFECLVDSKIELWQNIFYIFNLDAFYGFERLKPDNRQLRTEIVNALSFKLNSFLGVSAKHKWSFFDSMDYEQKYTESHFILSLDLKTDFKMF